MASFVFRVLVGFFGAILWSVSAAVAGAQAGQPAEPAAGTATQATQASLEPGALLPSLITLVPGEIRSVKVPDTITRIAVGNPDVVDVTILSSTEFLLQAKAAGTTNLLLWDAQGQHASQLEVADKTIEEQIARLLIQMNLPGIALKREHNKLFLLGELERAEDAARLQQMLGAYGTQVTNLVTVVPPPPPPPPPPGQSVTLTIQIIEMTRSSTDEFGVNWVSSLNNMAVTETPFTALGPAGVSQVARIGEAFRLGAFTRGALQTTLKLLVEQGKARILAEPKLVAGSGKEASAILGVEVPVVTATSVSAGVVTQNVEFKNTGVEMKFTPTILEDGHSIQLAIKSKVSSIDDSVALTTTGGAKVPGFRVRSSETQIVTEAGQSIMIAGLLQEDERKSLSQVPGVGSIPVFGNLFRSTKFTTGLTELVILVTPEMLEGEAETADRTFALEQALSRAEIAGSVKDPTLQYVLQVQDRIAKSLRYPQREKELGMSGRVKLRLHLFRDGTLGRAMIAESSGIDSFDAEALKASENQAPYPAFPSELIQQELWLEVPVIFRP